MTLERELLFILCAIVLLLAGSVVAVWFVVKGDERTKKFDSRMKEVVAPTARHPNPADEELSLTRQVSRAQMLQEKATGFIGVDLAQAETYPIKWWLVPPLTLALDGAILFLASHPLGDYKLLLLLVEFVGGPVIWLLLTRIVFGVFTRRRNAKLLEQFPDALGTVVRCVRVGIPMAEALRTVSRDAQEPTKGEFTILADKVSIGIPLDVALRELSMRIRLTEYQFFSTALTLQARSGGGITQTLETLGEVIRKRVGLKARGYALTAEARMSAIILSVLPFVAGGAIFVMQRDYMILLFTTKSGEAVLGAAILLMGTGMGIIQYMISSVLK
jgi:tight adherence protein B